MLLTSLILGTAMAGELQTYTQTTWAPDADVAGTDTWTNGYGADKWKGQPGGEVIIPRTTREAGLFSGDYNDDNPQDNWLVHGNPFQDGGVEVQLGNLGDNGIGLVLSVTKGQGFYVAMHSSDKVPPGFQRRNGDTIYLGRVRGKELKQLGRVDAGRGLDDKPVGMRFERNGSQLTVLFDGRKVIEVVDDAPLPPGKGGVWAYANGDEAPGWWSGGSRPAFVDTFRSYLLDTDDDKVADDADNCPDTPNPLQLDRNDDGIGDACDPSLPPLDTGMGGDTGGAPTDTGSAPTDTGGDGGPDATPGGGGASPDGAGGGAAGDFELLYPDEELVGVSCGCAQSAPVGAWWALLGLVALRRRTHR